MKPHLWASLAAFALIAFPAQAQTEDVPAKVGVSSTPAS